MGVVRGFFGPDQVMTATRLPVKNSARTITFSHTQYTPLYGFHKRTYALLCA